MPLDLQPCGFAINLPQWDQLTYPGPSLAGQVRDSPECWPLTLVWPKADWNTYVLETCLLQSKTTVEAVQAWVGKEFPDTQGVEGSEFIKNKDQRKSEPCEHSWPTSWQTGKNWLFLCVHSQFLQPQDKENSCWKVGVRWLIRVL